MMDRTKNIINYIKNHINIFTVITKRLKIRRWKKGIPKEDAISILLLIIYGISLIFIWVLPIYIKLIYVNSASIPIETVIGWFITLIAIVPTLTLTAVQLASGAYTYKLVSLYKNDAYFWTQLCIFLLIILMGISLKILEISNSQVILTFHSTALFGTLFLVPYFLHTFTSIGFEANVDRLISQVKPRGSFLFYLRTKHHSILISETHLLMLEPFWKKQSKIMICRHLDMS